MSAAPVWAAVVLYSEDVLRSAEFWTGVTGTDVLARGAYLRVGPPGARDATIALELAVADPAAAREAAVSSGARDGGGQSLCSPGGMPFGFVRGTGSPRPSPAAWAGGSRSQVDQVTLDIPAGRYDDEARFWQHLTGWELTPSSVAGFARLHSPDAQPLRWLLQRLDDDHGVVSAHLDLSADDRDAEVARHAALGARIGRRYDWWTVLTDPVGRPYCVTRRAPFGS